ncbi:hypothetical protein SAMN04490355_107013 [Pelosinus propionicus DSM 13327]|uniref:Uncharacterized protein n=1 Tax=Pelosinus propionicus DSM 13327 TaxID=1123291 RepID=A0A1I4PQQ0_9FIRM|nr:hypothetical protein SAMN04490355_107013 [Pelosinus propionicus DSM 13327]
MNLVEFELYCDIKENSISKRSVPYDEKKSF